MTVLNISKFMYVILYLLIEFFVFQFGLFEAYLLIDLVIISTLSHLYFSKKWAVFFICVPVFILSINYALFSLESISPTELIRFIIIWMTGSYFEF